MKKDILKSHQLSLKHKQLSSYVPPVCLFIVAICIPGKLILNTGRLQKRTGTGTAEMTKKTATLTSDRKQGKLRSAMLT